MKKERIIDNLLKDYEINKNAKRTKKIMVCLTEKEYELFNNNAKFFGKSKSSLVSQALKKEGLFEEIKIENI